MRDSLIEFTEIAGLDEQLVPYEIKDDEFAVVLLGVEAARFAIDLV